MIMSTPKQQKNNLNSASSSSSSSYSSYYYLFCKKSFIFLWILISCGQLAFLISQLLSEKHFKNYFTASQHQKLQQQLQFQNLHGKNITNNLDPTRIQNPTQTRQISEQTNVPTSPKEIYLDNYVKFEHGQNDLFSTEFSDQELKLFQQYEDCFKYVKENFKIEMTEDFVPGQKIYEDENQFQWANNNWTERIDFQRYSRFGSCKLCVRYKIWDGILYANSKDRKSLLQKYADFEFNLGPNEEQLLLATFLFQIPNSDFLVTFHATPQTDDSVPVIGPARNAGQRGFTMPHYYHWDSIAMSDEQLYNYQRCIDAKYPRNAERITKAVFRGTSTDSKIRTTTASTVLEIQRVKLGVLGRWHPDIMDIGINLQGTEKVVNEINSALKIQRDKISPGDHNKFELVISMDGIGYANRVSRHMLDNTPLLIVDSEIQEFFRHRMRPGVHYESLQPDLSDAVVRVKELLEELKTNRTRLDEQVFQMRNLARTAFNTTQSLHVTAYSISEFQKFINWQVKWESGFEPILHWKDSWYNQYLPQQFRDAVMAQMPQAFENAPCYKKSCSKK